MSRPPYTSFNLALHVGDRREDVLRNRTHLSRAIGDVPIVWMEQVHGDLIRLVAKTEAATFPACDALVTDLSGVALAVMTADCVPLLLYDTVRHVIAAVHAGRNSTFLKIAPKTVRTMQERFGCEAADIHALMGPSIGPCCYEIGEDLATIVEKSFGPHYMNGRYLDLRRLNAEMLEDVGVKARNIEISAICTACSPNYYSYRKEGKTGRFAGLIWMA